MKVYKLNVYRRQTDNQGKARISHYEGIICSLLITVESIGSI